MTEKLVGIFMVFWHYNSKMTNLEKMIDHWKSDIFLEENSYSRWKQTFQTKNDFEWFRSHSLTAR